MEELLSKYIYFFRYLKRGYNKGLGKAPHKPILLLSVLQLVKRKIITSNRIFITPELLLSFKSNWENLVDTKHVQNFSLPFFHLRSEPFWHLVIQSGMELTVNKSKSFKNLKESIAFAEIDRDLFLLMSNKETREILEEELLSHYFKISKKLYLTPNISKEEIKIEKEILNEPKANYQNLILELKNSLDDNDYQEEIFIRGGLFKKTIPKIYNYQCCISGMKIETSTNAQMVDACHIIPFSISHDDTIPNGISLSPNLHRAYDRGLITINKDYIVRISPTVKDYKSVYSISQFEGVKLILPKSPNWYPSPESLIWHTKEVFQL